MGQTCQVVEGKKQQEKKTTQGAIEREFGAATERVCVCAEGEKKCINMKRQRATEMSGDVRRQPEMDNGVEESERRREEGSEMDGRKVRLISGRRSGFPD